MEQQQFSLKIGGDEFVVKFKLIRPNMYHFEFFGAALNDRANRTWVEFVHNVGEDIELFARKKIKAMIIENREKRAIALKESLARLEKLIAKFKVSENLTTLYENLTGKKLVDIPQIQEMFIAYLHRKFAQEILADGVVWETLFRRFINEECWEESEVPEYKVAQQKQNDNRREILIAEIKKFTGINISPERRKEWIDWAIATQDNSEHPLVSWEKFNKKIDRHDIFLQAMSQLGDIAQQFVQLGKKKLVSN